MADSPYFDKVLAEMGALHASKNHDYAEDTNPFSNFEQAAAQAGVPVQQVFNVMLGIKQARLNVLLGGKRPNHESVRDNLLDRAVYAALAVACYDRDQDQAQDRGRQQTLDGIEDMLGRAEQRLVAKRVLLGPHIPPPPQPIGPNPITDVADFHTEGD